MRTRTRRAVQVMLAVAIVAGPLWTGLSLLANAGVRHHLDVFTVFVLSPFALLLPLAASLVGGLLLYSDLGDRFIATTRTRRSVRFWLARRFGTAVATTFAIGVVWAFVPFLISFVLWPLIGDPSIDPAGAFLTPAQAQREALTQEGFSFLLTAGDWGLGVGYPLWLGFCSAVFAALANTFLVLVPNRILALALPFVIFVAGMIGPVTAGVPDAGLDYSMFPAGLSNPGPPLAVAAPMLILAAATIALTAVALVRAPTNPRLS